MTVALSDSLSIYGFSFEYPAGGRLEFNPKFTREAGELAVKFPGAFVFVNWGPLDKVPSRSRDPEEHAKYSEKRLKARTRGKVSLLERKTVQVNGHRGVYQRMQESQSGLFMRGGAREQEARSLHVHCEQSNRYFVVFGALKPDNRDTQARTIDAIIGSLKCH